MVKNYRREWYPGKQFVPLVCQRKKSPLAFSAWVVWSQLVYAGRFGGRGLSARGLGRRTGLDRAATVPRALADLQGFGLVERQGSRWVALPPPPGAADWFVLKKPEKRSDDWRKNFVTLQVCVPRRPRLWRRAAVLFILYSPNVSERSKVKKTRRDLVNLTRLNRATVRGAVRWLVGQGLLYDIGGTLYLARPGPQHLGLFRDREPRPAPRAEGAGWTISQLFKVNTATLSDEARGLWDETVRRLDEVIQPVLLGSQYTPDDIKFYFEWVRNECRGSVKRLWVFTFEFLLEEGRLFLRAERETAAARRDGRFNGPNSLGLLRGLTTAYLERLPAKVEVFFGSTGS